MSIKQEKITEVRVVAIHSKVICDGCSAMMFEETHKVSMYYVEESYMPHFELAPGWVEMAKGQYGQRTYAHACGKCVDNRVEELLK